MRVNREVIARLLEQGDPLALAGERAVGKTTGAVLTALGKSYEQPGVWVAVEDPDVKGFVMRANEVKTTVLATLHLLGFSKINVKQEGARVYIQNNFAEML